MNHKVVIGLLEFSSKQRLASELEVDDVAHADVNYTEETLVALLELLLVKQLYGNY